MLETEKDLTDDLISLLCLGSGKQERYGAAAEYLLKQDILTVSFSLAHFFLDLNHC